MKETRSQAECQEDSWPIGQGTRVLCVDDQFTSYVSEFGKDLPQRAHVYTVERVAFGRCWKDWRRSGLGFLLWELDNEFQGRNLLFAIERFVVHEHRQAAADYVANPKKAVQPVPAESGKDDDGGARSLNSAWGEAQKRRYRRKEPPQPGVRLARDRWRQPVLCPPEDMDLLTTF